MKRFFAFLSVLVLAVFFCCPVWAEEEEPFPYVCDTVPLLTDSQWLSLYELAREISEQYQCAVYFITVDDYTDYGSGSIYNVAKGIYRDYDLGWGEEKSGVLLLLSMEERDYTLIAYGYGNTAFTDYGKDYLSEKFLDNFAEDDWAGGCRDYMNTCAELLKLAREGQPLDVGSRIRPFHVALVSIPLGFILAIVLCFLVQEAGKKKVSQGKEAGSYLSPGNMEITLREDHFVNSTQSRTKIERSSGSSGGTSVDSQGFSGKSGKF